MMEKGPPWCAFDAALDPAYRLPFDRLFFCETPLHCYAIGTDVTGSHYRVLKFSHSNGGTLDYNDDDKEYTSGEITDLISSLRGGKNTRVVKAKALLGCIRFTRGYYLVLATRRRRVARIGLHSIFEVTDVDLISLCETELPSLSLNSFPVSATSFLSRRTVEDYYRDQFLSTSLKQNFYYSHTYDLTNTLQANMTIPMADRKMRAKFVWNEFLLEPFFAPMTTNAGSSDAETLLSPVGISQWTVYLTHGSIVQFPTWCGTRPILLTLIGRVSKNFAGARYLRRGVSSDGHVANHVEVEQIVSDESTLNKHFTKGNFSSYVQVRGSVPLHWFHPPTQLPKPPIKLGVSNPYYTDTCKHFQELLEDYGAPLMIINLLKQREKRPREGILSREYRKAVMTLCTFMQKDSFKCKKVNGSHIRKDHVRTTPEGGNGKKKKNGDNVLDNSGSRASSVGDCDEDEDEDGGNSGTRVELSDVLLYDEFDIRESAHDAWNNVTAMSESSLNKTGFFACENGNVRRQKGVARSNCVDCIDRTNIAQFLFGLHALGHQLEAIHLLHSHVDLSLSPGVQDLLLHMYLLMGDAIAVQYGGSPQVGAGILNRGTGWDKIMGIKRLYNNAVGDREKQSALNLFLGRYQPYPKVYSTARNPIMRIPGADIGRNGDALLDNASFAAPRESIAGATGQDGRGGRVVDLSEIESDYYLQVKGAPALARRREVMDWWKKPLEQFHRTIRHVAKDAPRTIKNEKEEAMMKVICLSERARAVAQMDSESEGTASNTEAKISARGNIAVGGNMSNGTNDISETVQLVMTTSSNTLVNHIKMSPQPQPLSLAEKEFVWGLMQHQELNNDCVYYSPPLSYGTTTELLHDHRTYPDELKRCIFTENIETVRHLCDDCKPEKNLQRMQLAILTKYGDPVDWSADIVAQALAEVEEDVTLGTLNYLRLMNVDGYALLYKFSMDSMAEKASLSRFIDLVRQLPHASLDEARRCLEKHSESNIQQMVTTTEDASVERIAFPDATCRLVQPYFMEAVHPVTMATTVRRLLRAMVDIKYGVPRCDRLRYFEKADQRVPPSGVAMQCFGANELHQWLLCESDRLGLTLHRHVDSHEASKAAWKFILWLADANLVTRVIIEPPFGVIVRPPITKYDLLPRSNLFTLTPLQEVHILNSAEHYENSFKLSRKPKESVRAVEQESVGSIVAYAESLVSMALGTLTTVQEMASSHGDTTHGHVIQMMLNNIAGFVTHFSEDYIMSLRPREKWCFWANVFNILYIHAWLTAPFRRAENYSAFYSCNCYFIGGYTFSLSDIKDGILRGNKPPFYALLPPFEKNDPRLLFLPEEYSNNSGTSTDAESLEGETLRIEGRILLTLIDTFLVPNNLENATAYNPRTFLNDDQTHLDITSGSGDGITSGVVPILVGEANNGNDKDESGGPMDEDEDERSVLAHASRRASAFPGEAATWFTSWFRQNNRHGSKLAAFTHPCTPLIPTMLPEQLYSIEGHVIRSLTAVPFNSAQQCTLTLNGATVFRAALPLLFLSGEFGTTQDEVMRTLHQWHYNTMGRRSESLPVGNNSVSPERERASRYPAKATAP